MNTNKAQTLLISFLIDTLRTVYQESGKVEMAVEEIEETLKVLKISEVKSKGKGKPKVKKELKPEEQCIALKKDGDRCGGKKNEKGENAELCTLHNSKGVKFGFFIEQSQDEPEEQSEEEEEPEEQQQEVYEKQCEHVFTRGQKKNKNCPNIALEDSDYCKTHEKNKEQKRIIRREIEKDEEHISDEEFINDDVFINDEDLNSDDDLFGEDDPEFQ